MPTASVDLVRVAAPLFNVADPIPSVPSKNFTLPVGGLGPVDINVAVKVTGLPWIDGFKEELRFVVVLTAALPKSTPTPPLAQSVWVRHLFPTSTSGLASSLTTAIAIEFAFLPPELYRRAVWKVPSPLPKSTASAPV